MEQNKETDLMPTPEAGKILTEYHETLDFEFDSYAVVKYVSKYRHTMLKAVAKELAKHGCTCKCSVYRNSYTTIVDTMYVFRGERYTYITFKEAPYSWHLMGNSHNWSPLWKGEDFVFTVDEILASMISTKSKALQRYLSMKNLEDILTLDI